MIYFLGVISNNLERLNRINYMNTTKNIECKLDNHLIFKDTTINH